MEKRKKSRVYPEELVQDPDSSEDSESDSEEVMSECGCVRCDGEQQLYEQTKKKKTKQEAAEAPLLIHGLSVDRYKHIYNSVLTPTVLTALATAENTDYVASCLELKQCLWTELSRPRLTETLTEDGRVEVSEIYDLT